MLDHVIVCLSIAVGFNWLYYAIDLSIVTLKQNLIYLIWSFDYLVLWLISKWFKKRYAYIVPFLAIINQALTVKFITLRLDSLEEDQTLKQGMYSLLAVCYYLCECIFISVFLSPSMAFTGVATLGYCMAVVI